MVDLWFLCRRYMSPMSGPILPCPGAPGEQPAALMDAFAILDAAAAKETDNG
uniref:hypothetical protein n=1 Tax=uncultured Sphingomonas sp. TaxID=158754 RepID=UPI0035CA4965